MTHDLTDINHYRPVPSAAEIKQLEDIERALFGQTVPTADSSVSAVVEDRDTTPRPKPEQRGQAPLTDLRNEAKVTDQADSTSGAYQEIPSDNISEQPVPEAEKTDQDVTESDKTETSKVYGSHKRGMAYHVYNVAAFLPLVTLFLLGWFDFPALQSHFPHELGLSTGWMSGPDGLTTKRGLMVCNASLLFLTSLCFIGGLRGDVLFAIAGVLEGIISASMLGLECAARTCDWAHTLLPNILGAIIGGISGVVVFLVIVVAICAAAYYLFNLLPVIDEDTSTTKAS